MYNVSSFFVTLLQGAPGNPGEGYNEDLYGGIASNKFVCNFKLKYIYISKMQGDCASNKYYMHKYYSSKYSEICWYEKI